MGHQIVMQPNGKLALYSSIIDDFVVINANVEFLIEYEVGRFRAAIAKEINEKVFQLLEGKKPYFQFTKSFEECLRLIRFCHGEEGVQQLLDEIGDSDGTTR